MFRKYQLSFWVLKDYGIDNWTLKHTVTTLEIFGRNNIEFGYDVCDANYRVTIVHLEWNLVFLVGEDRTLIALLVFLSAITKYGDGIHSWQRH